MIKEEHNNIDLFISDDIRRQEDFVARAEDSVNSYEPSMAFNVLTDEQKEYLDLFSKAKGLDRMAVLHAHGNSERGKWTFEDNGSKSVQRWVSSKGRDYHGFLMLVCNPGGHEIKSRESILVYPCRDISISLSGGIRPSDNSGERQNYSFWVPKLGFLDNYVIGYEIEELRKKVG